MARNFYSEIYSHLTWHTKGSGRLLVPKVEAETHHYIRGRCINTPGVYIHEIGGIEDHIHLCLQIEPTITISELVGQLKGSPSHEVNQRMGRKVLEWQTGYGVVSFGKKDLPWVKDYVQNQRDRQGRNVVEDRLERITADESEQREAP